MNNILLCGILNKNDPLKVTDALLLALIGIVVVFIVLILLMLIVSLVGKIFDGSEKLKEKHPEWKLKLINTDERDAAMIMAIVADQTNTPLNELRFKSIKRVEDEEK